MKAKELLEKLSVCNPEVNYLNYITNCQLEDCNYEDVNGVVE